MEQRRFYIKCYMMKILSQKILQNKSYKKNINTYIMIIIIIFIITIIALLLSIITNNSR